MDSARLTPPRWATPVALPSSREIGPTSERDQHVGHTVRFTDIAITHTGYTDPAQREMKLERNLRLLHLGRRKECHAGIGRSWIYGRRTSPSVNGRIKEFGSTVVGFTSLSLSWL
jgi:hypothetical protein